MKKINGRITHKHDIEENWNKSVNFIPMSGEIIVYDIDETHSKTRIKVGNGVDTVVNLPFSVVDDIHIGANAPIDDSVNVWVDTDEESVGGGGVSSWNDLTDKPFNIVEEMPETQFVYDESFGAFVAQTDFEIAVGKTYVINWNGVEYISTARAGRLTLGENIVYVISVGNPVAIGLENNGLPFAVVRILFESSVKGLIGAAPLDGSTAVTVGIKGYTFNDTSDTLVLDVRYNTVAIPTIYATPAKLLEAFFSCKRIVFLTHGSTTDGVPVEFVLHTISTVSADGYSFIAFNTAGSSVRIIEFTYNNDGTYIPYID